MLARLSAVLCAFAIGLNAVAQDPPAEEEAAPADEAKTEAPAKPAVPESKKPLTGDVVHLKNGKVISGLQVLRETSMVIVLDVMHGEVTIDIPRRQVDRIDYDAIDPNKPETLGLAADADDESTLLEAQRISPETQRRLAIDISNPPLTFEATDFVAIIDQVNGRVDNVIDVDASVRELPEADRQWTFASTEGMTLSMFLKDALLKDFGSLELRYEADRILVTTKKAGEGAENESPGETSAPEPVAGESEPEAN